MGTVLPQLTPHQFRNRLTSYLHGHGGGAPDSATHPGQATAVNAELVKALFIHYQELVRWNRRLSLVGPGTAAAVVERHYGESLAALPLLPPGPGGLVDLGSGAGFPGWVLAAARPDWRVTLVEASGRKATFLRTAARRAGVPVDVVDGRVGRVLSDGFPRELDRITLRALKLEPEVLSAVAERLRHGGEVLFWAGHEAPEVPRGWRRTHELPLPGRSLRVLAYRPGSAHREAGAAR